MQEVSPSDRICSSRPKRWLFVGLGSLFLAIGVVGIIVPVLPTTPFLLLTAFFYARGSRRCHGWLMKNRVFGRHLDDYLSGRGISWKVKTWALTVLWTAIILSVVLAVKSWWIRGLLLFIAVAVTVHILTLKGGAAPPQAAPDRPLAPAAPDDAAAPDEPVVSNRQVAPATPDEPSPAVTLRSPGCERQRPS